MNNLGGWIHIFTVTDTQKHKGGYTIYKITSVIFPRALPEALTCLTVWKRFHDVKRLFRELSRRHKAFRLNGEIPEPTDASYFKRFDVEVIKRRKAYILELLDFTAQHSVLYKCHAFAQFFSGAEQTGGSSPASPSPLHRVDGTAQNSNNGILATLCDNAIAQKQDKKNLNGNEINDPALDKNHDSGNATADEQKCALSQRGEWQLDSAKYQPLGEKVESCKDYTRFLTPMASIESDDSDYIYEAALQFSCAVQAEANLDYQEAYTSYKCGVETLLNGSKEDGNDERKYIAKTKISKYLARADDIYDKFLRNAGNQSTGLNDAKMTTFQLSIDVSDCASGDATTALYLERPWNHLAKYKVLRVLGERVMQVQCITEPQRPVYVMKGIEKPSSNSPTQTVFLPQHVPYMVDLLAFFQSDQKIFLLLKYAGGGSLADYIRLYTPAADDDCRRVHYADLFPQVPGEDLATECLEVEVGTEVITDTPSTLHTPRAKSDFNELLHCSHQLLQSVSNTLNKAEVLNDTSSQATSIAKQVTPKRHRQLPRSSATIPEASIKQWARELAVAIRSLHNKGIILIDLNMDNLLLGAKGQLLLTYFYQNEGSGASIDDDRKNDNDNCVHKRLSHNALAGHYVAPERPLTQKSDWWSYGVILYELLLGLPFKQAHPGRLDLYGSVQYPEHMEISDEAQQILENLLLQESEERFGYDQLEQHAFFVGTNWSDVQRNGLNRT